MVTTLLHTVHAASGNAAAVSRSTPAGTGRHCTEGTATRVAYAPPASSAQTSSPTASPTTSAPTDDTTPEHSSPGTSVTPGGGGYWPRDCSRSARLTPAATTSTTTSPGSGDGSGRSTSPEGKT